MCKYFFYGSCKKKDLLTHFTYFIMKNIKYVKIYFRRQQYFNLFQNNLNGNYDNNCENQHSSQNYSLQKHFLNWIFLVSFKCRLFLVYKILNMKVQILQIKLFIPNAVYTNNKYNTIMINIINAIININDKIKQQCTL